MKKKYKLTGCARLFIFLLIFLPVVYVGVSYYHGDNPFEKLESIFSNGQKEKPTFSKEQFGVKDADELKDQLKSKNSEIEELKSKIDYLEKELNELKNQSHEH